MNCLELETAMKSKLARFLETLNERRSHCVVIEAEHDNSSAHLLQMNKNQLIDLEEDFGIFCNTSPNFGINSARSDINFIKSYSLPILVKERSVETIVIKKANQFVSFKFGNVHFLENLNFFKGATNLVFHS